MQSDNKTWAAQQHAGWISKLTTSSQHFPKSRLETWGVVMNPRHPEKCRTSPVQHLHARWTENSFSFFFFNWEPSIWWFVQQLNNNLKSILLDKQQGVSSLFSVSSSEHLNSVTVKCTQWALFAPVSWAFSHILLQAALTYTCIGALRKLNSFDLTEHFHPHTVMTSYPNEKNSSVNGQMGKMPLLGWSGANGLLFTTTTPPCWLQLQVRVQLLPWCRQ